MAKGAKRAYNKKQVERDRKRRGNRIRRVVFALLALCVVALAFVFLVFRGGSGISMGENAVGSVFADPKRLSLRFAIHKKLFYQLAGL